MMTITRVAWVISTFNVVTCAAFLVYRFMLFYGYVNITNTEDQNRFLVVTHKEFNPNLTLKLSDADLGFICEISSYFMGILFNVMLPLGVNTAREKVISIYFLIKIIP